MNKETFIANRKRLLEQMDDCSVAVLFAGLAPRKSGDETYTFTPNRNFFYVTGVDETKDIVLIAKCGADVLTQVFISPYDEVKAKWVGETYSSEYVKTVSGIDDVKYLYDFEENLDWCLARLGCKTIYFDLERQGFAEASTTAQDFANTFAKKYPSVVIKDIYPTLAKLRMVKSNEELEEIRGAIRITDLGLKNILKHLKPGLNESVMEAHFNFAIYTNGCSDNAFETIAASGGNACVLHYHGNCCEMHDGDLALFDLGAEYHHYKSDITRTYPVNGKFNPRQKQIYNIVLGGQKLVFANAKPGTTTRSLNMLLVKYYQQELKKIGLIKEDSEVTKYYFHGVSHHLGLDTHDAAYPCTLEPGMVITVEPGLYIAEEKIGIRIEDDVVITKDGCEVLSKNIIREIDEIEDYMKKQSF